jgi:hypothetical protein
MSEDLTGQTFGLLTVLRRAKPNIDKWVCDCTCGNTKIVQGRYLIEARVKSCGHLWRANTRRRGNAGVRAVDPDWDAA